MIDPWLSQSAFLNISAKLLNVLYFLVISQKKTSDLHHGVFTVILFPVMSIKKKKKSILHYIPA